MGASKNLEIVFPAQAGIQVCQQYPVFIKLGVKACLDAFAGTTGFLEVPKCQTPALARRFSRLWPAYRASASVLILNAA